MGCRGVEKHANKYKYVQHSTQPSETLELAAIHLMILLTGSLKDGNAIVVEVNNDFIISLEHDTKARRVLVFSRLSPIRPYLEDFQLVLQ